MKDLDFHFLNLKQSLYYFLETIGVEVILENELGIPLTLSNMALLWTFLPEEEDEEKRVENEVKILFQV